MDFTPHLSRGFLRNSGARVVCLKEVEIADFTPVSTFNAWRYGCLCLQSTVALARRFGFLVYAMKPPPKTVRPNDTAKISLSLDSHPVSLLWAHQLRREHKFLLDRVEDLNVKLQDDVEPNVTNAVAGTSEVSKDVELVKDELGKFQDVLDEIKDGVAVLENRLKNVEHDMSGMRKDTEQWQLRLQDTEGVLRDIRMDICRNGTPDGRVEMEELRAKIDLIERRVTELIDQEKILVPDSMERVGNLMKVPGMLRLTT